MAGSVIDRNIDVRWNLINTIVTVVTDLCQD